MPPKSLHDRIVTLERQLEELRIAVAFLRAADELRKTKKENPAKQKATLEEVTEFCLALELPASDAEYFFNKCEGNGWRNGNKAIRDWKATIRSWKIARYLPSQKQQYGTKGNQQNSAGDLNAGRYSRPHGPGAGAR